MLKSFKFLLPAVVLTAAFSYGAVDCNSSNLTAKQKKKCEAKQTKQSQAEPQANVIVPDYGIYKRRIHQNAPEEESNNSDGGSASSSNELVDSRDGQTYRTIQIGDRVWMAENLRFNAPGSLCLNNDNKNCDLGRFYKLEPVQQWCPDGWHLPALPEVACVMGKEGCVEMYPGQNSFATTVSDMVDGEKVGTALKSTENWKAAQDVAAGTDRLGFSVQPLGYYNGKKFKDFGGGAYFWTSTSDRGNLTVALPEVHVLQGKSDKKFAYYWYFYNDSEEMGVNTDDKNRYFSIRCIQDR